MKRALEPSVATTAMSLSGQRREPVTLLKRIGSTTFEVAVHFSETNKDTMEDILFRLTEREVDKIA